MTLSEKQPNQTGKSNRYRRAVVISIAVHLIGALVLLFWYLPDRSDQSATAVATQGQATDRVAPETDRSDTTPPVPPPAPDVPAEQIEASIASQIEQIEALPDERKLSELEKSLNRLDQVAEPASVKEVTSTIANTLGLDDQTYQPKSEVPDGPFDPSTAQIQDVTRTKSESGTWMYESVLVDADGRTATVPMSPDDGQTTYETFQQMKRFPMAEGIYRSVVMPLIQKTLDAAETAKDAALKAERATNEASPNAEPIDDDPDRS